MISEVMKHWVRCKSCGVAPMFPMYCKHEDCKVYFCSTCFEQHSHAGEEGVDDEIPELWA